MAADVSRNNEAIELETPYPPHSRTYPNLLGMAVRRKSLLALGVVVSSALGLLYYAQRTPVYRSDAQVLVIRKRPDALPLTGFDARLSYFEHEDYLSTHQVLIKSPLIVGGAVQKRELRGLSSFAGLPDPTSAIRASLAVGRDKDSGPSSNILNLSFRGKIAGECGTVLTAVIDSYKDFLDETYKNVNDDTVNLISKAKDLLQKDLARKEADYRDFCQKTPLLWKGKDGANLHQERLGNIESKRSALLLRRAEIQGHLAAIDSAAKDSRSQATWMATLPDVSRKTGSDGSKHLLPSTLEEQLLALLQQEQTLLEDYGPDHPQVRSLRKRIELTREFLERASRNNAEKKLGTEEGSGPLDPAQLYVQCLKQDLMDIQISEQLLAELFKAEYEEAKKLTNYEIQHDAYRSDIARTHQLYESILKRLQEVNLAKDFGGYDARIIAPATSGLRVEPNAFPILTAAAILGIMGGFGLAYLAEITDRSFHTPQEIRRRLGLPLVGHIPLLTPDEEALAAANSHAIALDPLLCTYYRSQSGQAESYRAVRTALYFSTQGKDRKVIQITSPNLADGKTTLVANLGVSIAQSGKRTILLDADFRRPRLDKMFGLSVQAGLAAVLAGQAEWKAVVQESAVSGLAILPCGPVPSNPAELLTSLRFEELLQVIRREYDFVLVDTPPLLAVTDPAVVAPRVDGVLLNIRVSKNGQPSAERAREILSSLGAPVLGIVVNGVDVHGDLGGYGYYHYRYHGDGVTG